jgi:uncharacterized small protein (DUF1192 family)
MQTTIPTTTTSTTSKPASAKSIDYLKQLFVERFGDELPVEAYEGLSQSEVSGRIARLQREAGRVPASSEAQERVVALGKQLGITVVPGPTQDVVNRQTRTLEARVRASEYRKGASDFDAFLATLTTPAPKPAARRRNAK